jgi:hypothetical protein
VGGAARQDIGVDFDASDTFGFLEDTWFLLAVLGLAVAAYALERVRGSRTRPERQVEPDPPGRPGARNPIEPGLLVLTLLFGALLFGASLEEGGRTGWPGLIAGAACALLGYLAIAALFSRARRRLEDATLLEVFADGTSLLLAALTILAPPLGYAVLVAFLVLLVRAGGERGKKYEGLRILR